MKRKFVKTAYNAAKDAGRYGASTAAGLGAAVYNTIRSAAKRKPVGKKRTFKRRKYSSQVVKPLNANQLKGVSKSFQRKVTKCLEHEKNWGWFIYSSCKSLRAATNDRWTIIQTCDNSSGGLSIDLFNPYQVWNDYSVLFNGKPLGTTGNWTDDITVGAAHNVPYESKIHILNSFATFEFKSTSTHEVIIEMYECSAKDDHDNAAYSDCADSFNNYEALYGDSAGVGVMSPVHPLTTAEMFIEAHKKWKMKVTKFTVLPGHSYTRRVTGPSGVIDGAKIAVNGAFPSYSGEYKNVNVFFRVTNKISVSTTGNVTAFPSITGGGVAMRYHRHAKFMPTAGGSNGAQNTESVIIQFMRGSLAGTDQQVVASNGYDRAQLLI